MITAADTDDTVAYFGKMQSGNGASAFPKVQGVYRCELGTHGVTKLRDSTIVDAGFWPCRFSEEALAYRLRRSVGAGMLVLFDRDLWAAERVFAVRSRGAHVPRHIPSNLKPVVEGPLPDGTHLVWVSPSSSRSPNMPPAEARKIRSGCWSGLCKYAILVSYATDDSSMWHAHARARFTACR